MNRFGIFLFPAALASATVLAAAVPEVSSVEMTQAKDRTVSIAYTLSEPAVVTLDIVTNTAAGWVSIGATNVVKATGDVWKRVDGGARTIAWNPVADWFGNSVTLAAGGVKAVVTAWATNAPPDYMVVDISTGVAPKTVNFYPSAAHLPGGLLGDDAYRKTKIVMRRIDAANVPWTMGSNFELGRHAATEAAHAVTLSENYYIGVFELTQAQFKEVAGFSISGHSALSDSPLRPVNQVSYNKMRCAPCTAAGANDYCGGGWPLAPYAGSFLDLLRQRTGVAFDLPTEAQWEFACRSGTHEGQWNDGSRMTESTIPGDWSFGRDSSKVTIRPVACGSYAPSRWGLYDMHGNVYELCHDWHQDDITALGGAANVSATDPTKMADGTAGSVRVRRGGASHVYYTACTASIRNATSNPAGSNDKWGYRLVCPACIAE